MDPTMLLGTGDLYRRQGDLPGAEQFYNRALSVREEELEAVIQLLLAYFPPLADIYVEQGRLGEAEVALPTCPRYRRKVTWRR